MEDNTMTGKINPHTQNESGGLPANDHQPNEIHDHDYPYTAASLGAGADVSLSLLSLLGMLACPIAAKRLLQDLAQTPHQRQELEALENLWQSLGQPDSGFWQHTRVFYNRIAEAVNPVES
jgi:hypothetical protein